MENFIARYSQKDIDVLESTYGHEIRFSKAATSSYLTSCPSLIDYILKIADRTKNFPDLILQEREIYPRSPEIVLNLGGL